MIFQALNKPEATSQALSILRSGENFNLYVIFMLVVVIFIYNSEVQKKNTKGIAAGIMLYMIHWFVEIINALIQKFTGHALWTVPTGTAFLILVGVGIELSLMFSIAGLAASRMLPDDPSKKMFGINVRWGFGLIFAALAAIIEIFLVMTPVFVWVYWWWNSLTVFIFVYIPFFVGANYAYYWEPKKQKMVIGGLAIINTILLLIFAVILPAATGDVWI